MYAEVRISRHAPLLLFRFYEGFPTARVLLARPAAREDGAGSLREDFDIQPQRPGSGIADVQPNHIVECDAAAAVHLPQSGNAGLYGQETLLVPQVVAVEFVDHGRTRTHQRHVAPKDI